MSFSLYSKEKGTTPYFETDQKFSFTLPTHWKVNSLLKSFSQEIQNFALEKRPSETWLGEKFRPPLPFKGFVFVDHYLDTKNHRILKANSAYRLRYRWSGIDRYLRYKIIPTTYGFGPDRCEIQFKENYQFTGQLSQSQEFRFEFRNDSLPFSIKKNAPMPPWKLEEFLSYAQVGQYQNYSIWPSKRALSYAKNEKLEEEIKLTTFRYRFHLNLKNPWGVGPNPDQLVLLTLDRLWPTFDKRQVYELECEVDRSSYASMENVINGNKKISPTAKAFTQSFLDRVLKDKESICLRLIGILKQYPIKELPTLNKYARFMNWNK